MLFINKKIKFMNIIKYKNHKIFYNLFSSNKKEDLISFIKNQKYKEILDFMKEDIILVLGWDWTMLSAIKEFYKENKAFLWINFWHKWFLLNSLEFIKKDFNYVKRTYPLLSVKTENQKEIAMNEVDIRAWEGKMISLEISLSKKQKLDIEWDWIIISTPAWSTWYNSSLWWPIIPHTLDTFVITPKAPWKPKSQSSILISDNEIIDIKNTWRKSPVEIYVDWKIFIKNKYKEDISLKIKKSKYNVDLIIASDYINIWDNKVLYEQWFYVDENI